MTTETSVVKSGTVSVQNGLMRLTGNSEFTADERKQIEARMTAESKRYIRGAGDEYLQLEIAEHDLAVAIKRAQRALCDTRQFKELQEYRANLKAIRARRSEILTKCLGVFESMLSGVRKGTALYKKMAMMLAGSQDGE